MTLPRTSRSERPCKMQNVNSRLALRPLEAPSRFRVHLLSSLSVIALRYSWRVSQGVQRDSSVPRPVNKRSYLGILPRPVQVDSLLLGATARSLATSRAALPS